MRRLDTEKPTRPALGLAPRPVAPSSRISPPEPVAAPGRGDGGRVVVCLHLHQDVDALLVIQVLTIGGAREEAATLAPSITAALSE